VLNPHLQLAAANAHGKPRPRLELDSAAVGASSAEVLLPAAKAAADTARADKAEVAVAGAKGSRGSAAAAPEGGQPVRDAAAAELAKAAKNASKDSGDSSQHAKPRLHGGIHGRVRSKAGGAASSSSSGNLHAAQHGQVEGSSGSGGSKGRRLHAIPHHSVQNFGTGTLHPATAVLVQAQRISRSRRLQQLGQAASARQRALVAVTGNKCAVLPSSGVTVRLQVELPQICS
jgi:hypothetical protein